MFKNMCRPQEDRVAVSGHLQAMPYTAFSWDKNRTDPILNAKTFQKFYDCSKHNGVSRENVKMKSMKQLHA